jgi:bacterioferritin (cytochrome b1)
MKGDPGVIATLQDALNKEASLAAMYYLNGKHLKHGLGVKTGKELMDLGKQCCSYKNKLLKRLFFLEATPEIAPDIAMLASDIPVTFDECVALEQNILGVYASLVRTAYDVNCMDVFHFAQHMCKWHTVGQGDFVGHLKYLEHEKTQLAALGLDGYIQAHI